MAAAHNRRQPRRAYNLAVLLEGRVVGWLGFGQTPEPSPRRFEFGYALLPSVWGRGSMTETLEAALAFMFGPLGADLVVGACETGNTASVRVMERAGMRLVHTRSEAEAGAAREVCRFVMDRPAWQLVRGTGLP
ncbi:GNAT family N-acetyltransferase [Deinococcus planocerae]|uniref:GNAT family N-acetyltransferase n=1 Tax=Deinococcus planocerae TaxID=1737569 RepID=UPI000C7EB336|nr:GNAT family N-acetyltransferase [Deinococcus planocerae]